MKTVYIESVGLKNGLPVGIYSSIEEFNADAKKNLKPGEPPLTVLDYANKYLAEKGSLVDGRDFLSTTLEKLVKFPMKSHVEKVTRADGTKVDRTVPDWSEREHINQFRAETAAKRFTAPGITVAIEGQTPVSIPGVAITGNEDVDDAAIESYLQAIVDAHGPFNVDASKPLRIGKEKVPPQYALAAADNIIKNASQKKWVKTFTTESIPFDDFSTPDAAVNRVRLAWAVKAREDAKSKKEYV